MSMRAFDAITRETAEAVSRRGSLLTLAGAALATLRTGNRAAANKTRKHTKKKGDVNQLCKRQVGQCLAFFIPQCEDAACHARINLCCPEFGTCSLSGFYDCAQAAQSMSARQAVRPERT
jgi:hypothetical protein